MPRAHRHDLLPDDDLWPSDRFPGMEPSQQAEHMRELRSRHNRIAYGYSDRDELMLALATSNALSRRDIAVATGLVESRVNQIVRELAEAHQQFRNAAAAEQVARHMPVSSVPGHAGS